jgi:hypothetical protein
MQHVTILDVTFIREPYLHQLFALASTAPPTLAFTCISLAKGLKYRNICVSLNTGARLVQAHTGKRAVEHEPTYLLIGCRDVQATVRGLCKLIREVHRSWLNTGDASKASQKADSKATGRVCTPGKDRRIDTAHASIFIGPQTTLSLCRAWPNVQEAK